MKRNRTRWIVLVAWLLPTLAMGLAVGLAPNVVTREADAGTFVGAELRPGGGFFSHSVTAVHTTRGTLAVADFFTALRGTPLVIVDSTRDGLQVCSNTRRMVCSDLTGLYVGELMPVPHARVWLTFAQRQWLEILLSYWAVLGLGVFAWALLIGAGDGDERGDDDACGRRPDREPRS